jgi:hypothetical protein
LDTTFNPGTGILGTIYTTVAQPDGKVFFGGSFTSYNGYSRNRVARFNADGSLDMSFDPGVGANSIVWATEIQPDGKVFIGGDFNGYANVFRGGIARLTSAVTIEFANVSTTSTDEATTDNVPMLLVKGTLDAPATIVVSNLGTGSATLTNDYTFSSPVTITIPAGTYDGTTATGVSITGLAIVDDSLIEGDETVNFKISNPSGVLIIGDTNNDSTVRTTTTYILNDDDNYSLSIQTSQNGSEPSTNVIYTVSITPSNQSGVPITGDVSYSGTASGSGVDYSAGGSTFSIANGSSSTTLTLVVQDDLLVEGSETVTATISNASTGIITTASANANIADNDVAGFTISKTSITMSEAGGTDTFTVVLTAQPDTDVVINISGSLLADMSLSTNSLTFTTANWNMPQTVTVTAIDDDIDRNDTGTITASISDASSDDDWDALSDKTVSAVFVDNDTAGVDISVIDSMTGESVSVGGNGKFEVVLKSEPLGSVTIYFTSSDTTEGTVVASATFTTTNWNVPQEITVNGIDDLVADGTISYQIITGDVVSTDTIYDAFTAADIADIDMSNQDDDSAGIIVQVLANTSEAGGTTTVRFSLTSQPAGGADVTIPLTISDLTEGSLAVSSITITNANWNSPAMNEIIVTGVDDYIVDGDISYTLLTGDPSSADPIYGNLVATDVANPSIVNVDNDVAGITISESGGTTNISESGTNDSYTIVLTSQPSSDVSISITVDDDISTSISTLTFTSTNWNVPQSITITAVDDTFVEGAHTGTINHLITSTDPEYSGMSMADVVASITDNDQYKVSIVKVSDGAEPSTGVSFQVQVSPVNDSGVAITGNLTYSGVAVNGTDYISAPNTFSIANGSSTTNITIAIQDDYLVEGTESVSVEISNLSTGIILVSSATANIEDNDIAGYQVSKSSIFMSEAGGTDTFSVVLTSQPSSDVVMDLTISPLGEATLSTSSLTFTSSNWNVPQVITVTGVDDNIDNDDTAIITISVSDVMSNDFWDTLLDTNVSVLLIDDDVTVISSSSTATATTITTTAISSSDISSATSSLSSSSSTTSSISSSSSSTISIVSSDSTLSSSSLSNSSSNNSSGSSSTNSSSQTSSIGSNSHYSSQIITSSSSSTKDLSATGYSFVQYFVLHVGLVFISVSTVLAYMYINKRGRRYLKF